MPICFSPLKSKVVRLTRLDTCGAPVDTGTKNSIVTDGFIKLDLKPSYDNGTDYTQKNAWGDLVITDQDPDRLKMLAITLDLSAVDPDSLDIVLGSRVMAQVQPTGGPATVGDTIGAAFGSNSTASNFAIETWTKLSGVCSAAGTPVWLYTVVPWVYNGTIGDLSFGNARVDYTYNAQSHACAGNWGSANNGPYATVPSPDFTVVTGEHFGQILTTVQPPEAACGAVAIV